MRGAELTTQTKLRPLFFSTGTRLEALVEHDGWDMEEELRFMVTALFF